MFSVLLTGCKTFFSAVNIPQITVVDMEPGPSGWPNTSPAANNVHAKQTRFFDANNTEDGYEKCFLKVSGMTCGSCVANIERNLKKVEGSINLLLMFHWLTCHITCVG